MTSNPIAGTKSRYPTLLALLASLVLLASCMTRPAAEPFATGLNQPRGLVFDDAGNLYVAEAGALAAQAAGGSPIATNQSGRVVRIAPEPTGDDRCGRAAVYPLHR